VLIVPAQPRKRYTRNTTPTEIRNLRID